MADRRRLATRGWLFRAGALLRVVAVLFVAVLASGIVHAHETASEPDEVSSGGRAAPAEAPHPGDDDDPGCPDGCCGPAHHCPCCSPVVVTCASNPPTVPAASQGIAPPPSTSDGSASGVRTRVERPPRR